MIRPWFRQAAVPWKTTTTQTRTSGENRVSTKPGVLHFVAEAFQGAEVVAGLAAGVRAAFVVVGAEVGVGGGGVGEQGVVDGQRGVAGGGEGFLLGHPPDQPAVSGAGEGLGAAGGDGGFAEGGAD